MKKLIPTLLTSLLFFSSSAQNNMQTAEALIERNDPGWTIIRKWIDSATNKIEVLPADTTQAREALFNIQETTHSPLGSVVYFTGGILVDHGWIRILGSGSKKLTRSLQAWNKGKGFTLSGEPAGFLLIADDAVGGFFAINRGRWGKEERDKIYYLSPDSLEWEALDLTYTEFLLFCFSGDLVKFYGAMRWKNWKKQVSKLSGDQVYNFSPPLWTTAGKNIAKDKRKAISAAEQYAFNINERDTLRLGRER